MTRLASVSTRVSPKRRVASWNGIGSESFTALESGVPCMNDLVGHLTDKGRVRVGKFHTGPQVVRHPGAAQAKFRMYLLHLQLEGESLNRQDQRDARLHPGDMTICDNSRPYEVVFEQPSVMLVYAFGDDLRRRYIQYPQSITAMPLSGKKGIGGLLSDFLADVWRHSQEDRAFEMSAGVSDAILGLLASAYRELLGSAIDHSSLGAAHRVRIIHYIEEHLGDSSLTPTRIAESFRITTRYLHHLFADEDETVARYILRRRLEECARALSSRSQRKRTITSIAFDYGFGSATHFGRAFRSRYALTPREYRHRNLAAGQRDALSGALCP